MKKKKSWLRFIPEDRDTWLALGGLVVCLVVWVGCMAIMVLDLSNKLSHFH